MSDNPKILLNNDKTAEMATRLKSLVPSATVIECNTYSEVPDAIAQSRPDVVYSVRFAGSDGFPRDALFSENGPKWLANGGAGTDHLGLWDTQRVTVTNAAGIAADMMAEYAMGCFLHFTLDIPGLQADKEGRVWAARTVRPLKDKTLFILGLGHTGRAAAQRAKAFGMHVTGIRARPVPMKNVDVVGSPKDLAFMLEQADFILVCTPLTEHTRGLIGKAEVQHMRPGVILVDVSRGSIVEQSALLDGLESGRIAAAALDVFETEPLPENNPLWEQDNLIISPHCSSVHAGWEDASFDLFLSNLKRWMAGEALVNVVDPARGY